MQKGVRFYDSSHRKNARLSMPSIRQRSAIAGTSLDLAHHDLGDGLRVGLAAGGAHDSADNR
ncbi:hypothetical protein ABG818_02570, partial [Bifidobacterium adolescentis]